MKDHGSFRNGDSRLFAPLLIMLAALMAVSCIDDPPTSPEVNDYQSYLDLVWGLYDQKYVGFDEKDVDWDAVHDQYSQMMLQADSLGDMQEVIIQMLGELSDRNSFFTGGGTVPTDTDEVDVNYNMNVLLTYLKRMNFHYGTMWSHATIDSIPYFAINHFDYFFTFQHLRDTVFANLDAPGMIIDLRMSDGFSLVPAQQIPGLFTRDPMDGFYTQYRCGPEHDDLSDLQVHTITPRLWAFNKPVVILCGEQNIGPAEAFLSVMERLPYVTIIGDTTGGGGNTPGYMSQQYWPVDPGKYVTCPFARVLRSDSTSLEDSGIVPDIYFDYSPSGVNEEDYLLEFAVDWIEEETSR